MTFGAPLADAIKDNLIAMRDGGLLDEAEVKDNADIIGVVLNVDSISDDQRNRAKALRDKHIDELKKQSAAKTENDTGSKTGNSPERSETNPVELLKEPREINGEPENITGSAVNGEQTVNEPKNTESEKSSDKGDEKSSCDDHNGMPPDDGELNAETLKENIDESELPKENQSNASDQESTHEDKTSEFSGRASEDDQGTDGDKADYNQGTNQGAEPENRLKQNAALHRMIRDRVAADINAVAENDVQEALARINMANPVEFGLLFEDISEKDKEADYPGIKGTAKSILKKIVEEKTIKLELAAKRALESVETELDRRAKVRVREIIAEGTAFEYIYRVWQSRVKGNANLGQALILSRSAQSCVNTKGLHIWAMGMPGQGKSEGEIVMAALLPPAYVIDTDPSPKVLYYMQDSIQPGTTVLIDDIDLVSALAGLFKKMTTRYQEGARHDVVLDGEVYAYQLPPRVNIWTSSVDMQGDEQSRDRFIFIPIDEKQTASIIGFMKNKDKNPKPAEDKDLETAIVRGLLLDLTQQTFYVEIPFTDEFDFPATQGTRGYGIFSDLIKSLTVYRYAVRKMDAEGHLLAEPQDFYDAKALYEALEGHSAMSFTTSEKDVLDAVIRLNRRATLVQLEKESGKSIPRLKEIFNGRKDTEQQRHGLLAKCPSLSVESESISTLTRYSEDKSETKSNKCNVYTLDPAFRLIRGRTELISVIPGTTLDKSRKSDTAASAM